MNCVIRKNVIVRSLQRAGGRCKPVMDAIVPLSRHSGDEPEGCAPYSASSGLLYTGKLGGNAESSVPDDWDRRLFYFHCNIF